jgi:hypothetical protein
MSSGPPQYVATPVSLLKQRGHEAPLNSTSTKPRVRNIQLFQKAPSCIYNSKRHYSVGELTADQCAQVQNCTATANGCTVDRLWCSSPGIFFVCGTLAYQCLPANWKGICTLAFLTPQINIVPNNQTLPVPLIAHSRSKRAIQFIPLLIGLRITAGIGTGIGGIASSAAYYNQLSAELTSDIEQVAKSITTMQDQLDSLASVVLQNRRGLDLLTAEKGGLCLFLNEECCFYVNQSGIVRDMAQQLQDRVARRRQELANSWNRWSNIWNWALWLVPLSGPIFMLLLALIFGPCILNAITRFISSRMEAIKLQLLVTQYRPLGQQESYGISKV